MNDNVIKKLLDLIDRNGDCGYLMCDECPIDSRGNIGIMAFIKHPCYENGNDGDVNSKYVRSTAIKRLIKICGKQKAYEKIIERLI